ncbi:MAG: hypothetical protein L3J93_06460, partial [Thermoplasmata archaeon]|nr:hypothetical protein [Thermoplasmata archaeon]
SADAQTFVGSLWSLPHLPAAPLGLELGVGAGQPPPVGIPRLSDRRQQCRRFGYGSPQAAAS